MISSGSPGISDRVALVTGAAGGGCGTEIARQLAMAGAIVVANGLPRHRGMLAELTNVDNRVYAAEADIADESAVDRLVTEIVDTHGRLDIVVHNAAPSVPHTGVVELTTPAWRADLGVILDGAFFLSRAAARHMRQAGWGRFVFVSSSGAFRGARGRSIAYSAAKAGLHGLVAQLALELGPDGITANAVAPSQIDSSRVRRNGRRDDASLRRYAGTLPVRRVGSPADLAALVTYLVSPASGYLTGQVLRLDGGSALAGAETATLDESGVR